MNVASKAGTVQKVHLWLAFGREGGGGHGTVGIPGISGGLTKKEWKKTGNDKCRCPFSYALLGPPTSWVPPRISPSPTPPLID